MIDKLSPTQKELLIPYLSSFVTEERKNRFAEVLSQRTNHIHIVLEDVYQSHNASAVLRSADCFGVQYVHFIENRNKYSVSNEVALGSSQWLTIKRHKSTTQAISHLREQGFKIVAASPHKQQKSLYNYDITKKFALFFGTEKTGLTPDLLQNADEFLFVPMRGFTESFNISVCAALCMHELTAKIKHELPELFLSTIEQRDIHLQWLIQSIKRPELLIKEFLKT